MTQPSLCTDAAGVSPRDLDTVVENFVPFTLHVRAAGLTHSGHVRPTNQDQFLIALLLKALQVEQTSLPQPLLRSSSDRSYLFVVADGMGGHAGGEQASALAIDSVETFVLQTLKWFAQCKGQEQDQVLIDFQNALGHANARVLAEAAEQPQLHGMGTTLTLAYTLNDVLFVAHAGDSRCYLRRDNVLHRLTRDHTLVEDMIRRGALKANEASHHRWRHVITNAVGGDSAQLKVELHKLSLQPHDVLLLCSDGLTEMVAEDVVSGILGAHSEPADACRELVARANDAGGRDNVTVIVAHFDEAK